MSQDPPSSRRQAWAWALRTTAFALLGMLAASTAAQVASPGDRGLALAVLGQGLVFLGIGAWARGELRQQGPALGRGAKQTGHALPHPGREQAHAVGRGLVGHLLVYGEHAAVGWGEL